MVVHRTGLPYFPTDGDEFIVRGFVDKVAGVVLAIPCEIRTQALGIDERSLQEPENLIRVFKSRSRELLEGGNKFAQGNLSGFRLHRHC